MWSTSPARGVPLRLDVGRWCPTASRAANAGARMAVDAARRDRRVRHGVGPRPRPTSAFPTGADAAAALIVAGLGVTCIGHGWRRFGRVLLDWLPFTLVLVLYDYSRGVAARIGLPLHETDIAHAEARLFGGTIPTVWLQHHSCTTPPCTGTTPWPRWSTRAISSPPRRWRPCCGCAQPEAVDLLRGPGRGPVLRRRGHLRALPGGAAVVRGAAPRHRAGARLSARGWDWLHIARRAHLLGAAQRAGSNPVAAMPSLHTAFAMLVAMFIARQLPAAGGICSMLYPALMGLALIYTRRALRHRRGGRCRLCSSGQFRRQSVRATRSAARDRRRRGGRSGRGTWSGLGGAAPGALALL